MKLDRPHDREPELIIAQELPIVDAHHHLWLRPEAVLAEMESNDSILFRALAPMHRLYARYLFEEFLEDVTSGHNVRASVYVDAYSMYRATGPEEMRSVGEVEFVNGVAAMAASGLFGDVHVCAGIVGGVDLSIGDVVEDVLVAHIRAGGGRYRGVRSPVVYDADFSLLGGLGAPHLLLDRTFRAGFKKLQPLGLSFDVFLLEPQLPDLIDLARAFPETQIVLNHVGTPVGVGPYAGRREERFPIWRDSMRVLSTCDNVVVKLGGLGIPLPGFDSYFADPPFTSAQLADEWRPYLETCIELFGAERCMFESNVPPDLATGSYRAIWNAFKRIAAGASPSEQTALFSGTAIRVYRLPKFDDSVALQTEIG